MFELLILAVVAFVAIVAYYVIKDHTSVAAAIPVAEAEIKSVVNTAIADVKADVTPKAKTTESVDPAPGANTSA